MPQKYKENAEGQLEIDGIDTPLGKAANDYLIAVDKMNKADEDVKECREEVKALMKDHGMKSFNYEGKMFTITEEKIVEEGLRVTNKTRKSKQSED